jgi:uncharacterized protein YjbI with pentapeptide repeats
MPLILRALVIAKTLTVFAHAGMAQETAPPEMRMMGQCAGCIVSNTSYVDARLTGIQLRGSEISDVVFNDATLSISIFDDARLTNVSFDGANLRGASFVDAVLVNVSFVDADMQAAVFEGAILEQTDLTTGRLCKTQMPDDEMNNSGCN